ncbi:unnamed protein product [Darwinula stevensoni]|uniref:tRNA (guanine-N(7)-)-methyltransferase non-catalytic subunit n=1 Tax=Darwinula stevensoni TaxID=69355 RepID=A0A7R8XGP3_9CRUS|nr:unnamed protein product [Darwinula stevensoni]CAG0891679.1 unnamed protein product [Darwinula stevensoni]
MKLKPRTPQPDVERRERLALVLHCGCPMDIAMLRISYGPPNTSSSVESNLAKILPLHITKSVRNNRNICRSPIAEAVFVQTLEKKGLKDKWTADSAALGDWHVGNTPDRRARNCMKKNGVPMDHKARQVDREDFFKFDWIFGMDEENIQALNRISPKGHKAKIELLGKYDPEKELIIRDPYYFLSCQEIDGGAHFLHLLSGSKALIIHQNENSGTCREKILDTARYKVHVTKGNNQDDANGQLEKPCKKSKLKNDALELTGACVSPNGKFLATVDSVKQLTVWDVSTWGVQHVWALQKRAYCIQWNRDSSSLLLADKAGDVYSYSVEPYKAAGSLILGHVSMLMDMALTKEEDYIVTCDRDEKIRVSHYPNAYDIHGFCLGHTECVLQLEFLPEDANILISSSADCTIRFWDYHKCQELFCLDCRGSIEKQLKLNMKIETSEKKKQPDHPPIQRFLMWRKYLLVSIYKVPVIFLYEVERTKTGISVQLHQTHALALPLVDVCMLPVGHLCIFLSNFTITIHHVQNNRLECDTDPSKEDLPLIRQLMDAVSREKHLLSAVNWESAQELFLSLYKSWYDNVEEYQQKKMMRLQELKETKPPPRKVMKMESMAGSTV